MHYALNLRSIGVNCFKRCKKLRGQIVLPETLEELGEGAFKNCLNIDSVTIFPGVKKVNKSTFSKCEKLKTVYFTTGENIINQPLELDDSCFRDCPSLDTVVFRRRVTKISKNSFHGCPNLKNIIFHEPPSFREFPFSTNPSKQPSLRKIVVPEGFRFTNLPRDCLDLVVNESDNSNVSLKNNFFNNNLEDSSNTHVVPPKRRTNPPSRQMHQYRANRGRSGRRRGRHVGDGRLPDRRGRRFRNQAGEEPIVSGTKKKLKIRKTEKP